MDSLDTFFLQTLDAIQKEYTKFPRFLQIRIEQWCTKLSEENIHVEWKKNRNYYCLYLLQCIYNKEFKEPFDRKPTGEPLGKLPAYIILSLPKSLLTLIKPNGILPTPSSGISTTATKKLFSKVNNTNQNQNQGLSSQNNNSTTSDILPNTVNDNTNTTSNNLLYDSNLPSTFLPHLQDYDKITSRPRQVTRWDGIITNIAGNSTLPNTNNQSNEPPITSIPLSKNTVSTNNHPASIYTNILLPSTSTTTNQPTTTESNKSTTIPKHHQATSRGRDNVRKHHHSAGIMFHPHNHHKHYHHHHHKKIAKHTTKENPDSSDWNDESFDSGSITDSVLSRHERDASYLRSDSEEMERRSRAAQESRQSSLSSQRSKVRFANNQDNNNEEPRKTPVGIERALIDAQEMVNRLQKELHHAKKQLTMYTEDLRTSYIHKQNNEKFILQLENQIQTYQLQIQSLTKYMLEVQEQYKTNLTTKEENYIKQLTEIEHKYISQITILKQQIGNKFLKWILHKENKQRTTEMEELFSNIHLTPEEEKYIDDDDDVVDLITLSTTKRNKKSTTAKSNIPSVSTTSTTHIVKETTTNIAKVDTSVVDSTNIASSTSFTSPVSKKDDNNINKEKTSPITPLTFFSGSPTQDEQDIEVNRLLSSPSSSPLLPTGTIESLTETSRGKLRPLPLLSTKVQETEDKKIILAPNIPIPSTSNSMKTTTISNEEPNNRDNKVISKSKVTKKTKPTKTLPDRPSLYNVFPIEKVLPYPYSSNAPPSTTTTTTTSNIISSEPLISPIITDSSFLSSSSTIFSTSSNTNNDQTDLLPSSSSKTKSQPRWRGQLAASSTDKSRSKTTVPVTSTIPYVSSTENNTKNTATIPVMVDKGLLSTPANTNNTNNNAYGYETNPTWNEPIIPLQIPFTLPYGTHK